MGARQDAIQLKLYPMRVKFLHRIKQRNSAENCVSRCVLSVFDPNPSEEAVKSAILLSAFIAKTTAQ
ncbi:MAG: hypothetical protein AAFW70_08285 [Cyanobacteria bacterium J06635_10]